MGSITEYVHPDLAFQLTRIGSLGLVVWNGEPPNDAVFEDHCLVIESWVREDGPLRVFLNVAGNFAATSSQRRIVAAHGDAMGLPAIQRIAILTDSAIARGALLVMTWLTRTRTVETRGFRPFDAMAALDWLGEVEPIDREAALTALERAEVRFSTSRGAVG